jgi:hypothetical protein
MAYYLFEAKYSTAAIKAMVEKPQAVRLLPGL